MENKRIEEVATIAPPREDLEVLIAVRVNGPINLDSVRKLTHSLDDLTNIRHAPIDKRTLTLGLDNKCLDFRFETDYQSPVFGMLVERKKAGTEQAVTVMIVLCAKNDPHKNTYTEHFSGLLAA